MRIKISVLVVSTAVLWACSSSNSSMEGARSDGLHVVCESAEQEDVQTCTPEDGDAECESWEEGGPAVILWPPNHKLIRFSLDVCAARDCDDDDDGGDVGDDDGDDDGDDGGDVDAGPDDGGDAGDDVGVEVAAQRPRRSLRRADPASITSITADEDVEVGAGGDGHTTDFDMAIVDETTFELRSERQGGGDGRVYRVNYLDSDGAEGSCEFMVPHDHRKPFGGATDSGTVVTVTP